MSKWFWIISMRQALPRGGEQSITVAAECELPDGFSRRTIFEEVQKAALRMADWQGGVTVMFYSLEPAVITSGESAS